MIASLLSGLRRLRITLVGVIAALATALIITPAHAAGELSHVSGATIATVCVVGTLAFAFAFEFWQIGKHRAASRRHNIQD